jgi:hypothetical protein
MFSSFASAALLLEKVALDPSAMKMLASGVGGAALAGVPTYLLTRALNRHERERTRDRAFGAGVATGLAGPKIIQGLFNIAQGSGFMGPQPSAQPPQMSQPSWGPL